MGFYFVNGQQVAEAKVGDVLTFEEPGHGKIWITQERDGAIPYDGPLSVPMAPRTLTVADVGTYKTTTYTLNADNTKGGYISQVHFKVIPAGTSGGGTITGCAAGVCGVTPTGTSGGGSSSGSGGGGGTGMPTPVTVNLGGVNVSPGSGSFGGGQSAGQPTTSPSNTPSPVQMATTFDWQTFIKSPWGIGLVIFVGLVILAQMRKGGN